MRVLALTHNASLLVALGSMMREWEVVSARDVESALQHEPGSVVALIDFGDTQEGLKAATELYQQGVTIPAVVLGDEPAEGAIAFVLVRPFSLEDLATAVSEASTRPAAAPPRPVKAEPPPAAPPPAKGSRAEENGTASKARTEPATPRDEPAAKPQKSRPLSVVPPAEAPSAAPKVAPPPPRQAAPTPAPASQAPVTKPTVEPPKPARKPEPAPKPQEPAARAEPARPAAPEPPATRVEAPTQPRVEPPQPQRPAMAASTAATAPELEMEEPAGQAQGRWRLRRKPAPRGGVVESAESPMIRQLKQAAKNAADLETLIDELPFLADLGSMADGLVAEVEAQFSTQVASVFVRRQDGYHVIAHRGLSRVESGMVVAETQPLFSDVLQTGEGILIQPVDLAQGLVAGIGGARTEALMAVPAVVHGACVAIIIAGQSRFGEVELDRLSELANEAAPGLAVALALARLRERI